MICMEKWGTISLSSVCSEFETKGTMTMGHGKGPLLEYVCSCTHKCLWNPVPPIMQTYLINLLVPKREEHHSVRCNQSTVFFLSHQTSTSQPVVFLSHNKSAPATSHSTANRGFVADEEEIILGTPVPNVVPACVSVVASSSWTFQLVPKVV